MAGFREPQLYVDTSVFGGVFDEEFSKASRTFFDQVEEGRFLLMTSPLVVDEVGKAPAQVRELFERVARLARLVDIDDRALALQAAYLSAGVVGSKHGDDALHVALATVGGANLIVSWNSSTSFTLRKSHTTML